MAVDSTDMMPFDSYFEHFLTSLRHNSLFEVSQFFLSKGSLAKMTLAQLNNIARQQKLVLRPRLLQSKGRLLKSHYCNSIAFYREPRELADFSGSGDANENSNAIHLSIFEAMERFCYLNAKGSSIRPRAFKLDDKNLEVDISFKPLSGTGTAIHRTPRTALTNSILEILERDAYLSHWYTGKPPQRLSPTIISESQLANNKAMELGLELNLYKLSSVDPSVHVVLATTQDKQYRFGNTGFCSGLAASFSLKQAILKALFELDRFVDLHLTLGEKANEIKLPDDHPMSRFYFYLRPENLNALSVFISDKNDFTKIDSDEVKLSGKTSLSELLHSLNKMNHEIFVFPLSVPEKLRNHLFCSHVYIPTLQQLDYNEKPVLNFERLKIFDPHCKHPRALKHPLP